MNKDLKKVGVLGRETMKGPAVWEFRVYSFAALEFRMA